MNMITTHSPLKRLSQSKKLLIVVGLVCAALGAGITMIFPLSYRADAQVFILSHDRFNVDPYTVAKSGERIGENLAQVMRTDDFYGKVKSQENTGIEWGYFNEADSRERKKIWERTITPAVVYGTSILTISMYHPRQDQAVALAGAAATALVTQSFEYVGGDVSIRLVNPPISTKIPVRPNPLVNALAGALAGMFIVALAIVRK